MKKYIFLALILSPLGFLTHGLLTSLTIPKKDMDRRIAQRKELEALESAKNLELAKHHLDKMVRLSQKTQTMPDVQKLCPENLPERVSYASTDFQLFEHFASGVYTKATAHPEADTWYRSEPFQNLAHRLGRLDAPEKIETWDASVLMTLKDLEKFPYFLILYPEKFAWPVINEKNGGFIPGYFDGWQVLIDTATGETVCQIKLFAQNSDSVEFRKYKLRHLITVHSNAKNKVFEDLNTNFWSAVEANFRKRSSL
jgi:hypothetical protein